MPGIEVINERPSSTGLSRYMGSTIHGVAIERSKCAGGASCSHYPSVQEFKPFPSLLLFVF